MARYQAFSFAKYNGTGLEALVLEAFDLNRKLCMDSVPQVAEISMETDQGGCHLLVFHRGCAPNSRTGIPEHSKARIGLSFPEEYEPRILSSIHSLGKVAQT